MLMWKNATAKFGFIHYRSDPIENIPAQERQAATDKLTPAPL